MTRYVRALVALALAAALVAAGGAAAAAERINTLDKSGLFGRYKPSGIAIGGFDTVAYFTRGEAVEGSDRHSAEWQAKWERDHRELIEQADMRYEVLLAVRAARLTSLAWRMR